MEKTFSSYINYLQRDFLEYTKNELKKVNLSYGQLPFILYIGKHHECTQSELTEKLHLDWGYSQRSIVKLCNEGFIKKTAKDNDNRISYLSLTEVGEKAFTISHDVFFAWDKANLEGLSVEEKTELMTILQKIIEAKKPNYPKCNKPKE